MTEGSVEVDNGTLPVGDDTGSSQTDDNQSDQTDDGEVEEKSDTTTEGKEEDVSDKGTKLDPNPESRANQLRANAEAKLRQYERVLSDPDLLRRYAKEAGISLTEAKAEIKEEQKEEKKTLFAPDRFNTSKDVADALNELHNNFNTELGSLKSENQKLKETLSGFTKSSEIQRVATTMAQDVQYIQSTYPQLNPKSPEYDKALENEIGSFYHELDAIDPNDPNSGYRGSVSLAKLTDRFMRSRDSGMKTGSEKAQTDVKVKQAGKVVTSGRSASKESESRDPSTVIAQRIAKAMGH